MKKLLTIIAAMVICDAYGAETVYWFTNGIDTFTNNTCTTGGNITKPSNPTKSGYRFMGWESKTKSTISLPSVTSNNIYEVTYYSGNFWISKPKAAYNSFDRLFGISQCSSDSGSRATDSSSATAKATISDTTGKNCWCKLVAVGDAAGNVYDFSGRTFWTYDNNFSCDESNCTYNCVFMISTFKNYRDVITRLYY